METKKKKILIIALILLAVAYFSGVFYFSNYSYPNTFVGGSNKGWILSSKVFEYSYPNYSLTIKGRDGAEVTIDTKDIELTRTVEGTPTLNQNPWLWFVEVFQTHEYDVTYNCNFNKIKLDKIIKESDLMKKIIEPKDARIEITDEGINLIKEVMGNKLDKKLFDENIENALAQSIEELVLEEEYINPEVMANDPALQANYEKFKSIAEKSYVFDFEDREWVLAGKNFLEMYDETDEGLVLNVEKLKDYVADIAKETDTYAKSHKFKATGIGEITVPGGIYGWQMNVAKTVDNLLAMVEEGTDGPVEIVYNQTARHRTKNDIGSTYIEIDLSRQTMWMYKKGELLIKTPIVTGDARKKSVATPVGVNKVWSKERDIKLLGVNGIHGYSYAYPVSYWMPVGWTGSGIHDNTTRDAFGGEIYKTWGSNGCINTPPDAMKTIYENTALGTPVVIYESSTNYSPTEFEKQAMKRANSSD